MNPGWITAGVAVLMLAAQVVGFYYLTRNHLAHLQKSLDGVLDALNGPEGLTTRVGRLEGRLDSGVPNR